VAQGRQFDVDGDQRLDDLVMQFTADLLSQLLLGHNNLTRQLAEFSPHDVRLEKKCLMLLVAFRMIETEACSCLFVATNSDVRSATKSFEFSSVNGQLRLGAVQRFLDLFAFADFLLQEGVVRDELIEESLDSKCCRRTSSML